MILINTNLYPEADYFEEMQKKISSTIDSIVLNQYIANLSSTTYQGEANENNGK